MLCKWFDRQFERVCRSLDMSKCFRFGVCRITHYAYITLCISSKIDPNIIRLMFWHKPCVSFCFLEYHRTPTFCVSLAFFPCCGCWHSNSRHDGLDSTTPPSCANFRCAHADVAVEGDDLWNMRKCPLLWRVVRPSASAPRANKHVSIHPGHCDLWYRKV